MPYLFSFFFCLCCCVCLFVFVVVCLLLVTGSRSAALWLPNGFMFWRAASSSRIVDVVGGGHKPPPEFRTPRINPNSIPLVTPDSHPVRSRGGPRNANRLPIANRNRKIEPKNAFCPSFRKIVLSCLQKCRRSNFACQSSKNVATVSMLVCFLFCLFTFYITCLKISKSLCNFSRIDRSIDRAIFV